MDRRHFLKTTAGAAALTLAAPYLARAATITMRFAHFAEEGHPANIAAKQFASQIEKRTDGAIKIAILIAPSVRFSIWLANCLAAIFAGWPSSAKCAKRIVMVAARAI